MIESKPFQTGETHDRDALAKLKHPNLRFDGLDSIAALTAAAQLTEAAAFNLAKDLPSDDILDLLMIVQQLDEFAKYVTASQTVPRPDPKKLI